MNAISRIENASHTATLVRSPDDMAQLLHSACPEQAHPYALASHERACAAADEERTAFWSEVVRLLSDGCGKMGARLSPMPVELLRAAG